MFYFFLPSTYFPHSSILRHRQRTSCFQGKKFYFTPYKSRKTKTFMTKNLYYNDMKPCRLVQVTFRSFGGAYCLLLQGRFCFNYPEARNIFHHENYIYKITMRLILEVWNIYLNFCQKFGSVFYFYQTSEVPCGRERIQWKERVSNLCSFEVSKLNFVCAV